MSTAAPEMVCPVCTRPLPDPREPCPHCVPHALPLPSAQLVRDEAVPELVAVGPRRSVLEILLDPRGIQALLMVGGVLLVLGLVIWLATLGFFENPWVLAGLLGAGTGVLLAGGWALIAYTRYQTAGRSLTLLACLVMPLNLWFYSSYSLVMLDGHLWVAALVCCALYAVSARLLRDPLFVYVLMAGVTLTGLLMLADVYGALFLEAAPHCTLLVALGLLGIALERAFPDDDGPFNRRRFGRAFFRSGHSLLAAGLATLLVVQVFGWAHTPLSEAFDLRAVEALGVVPALVTDTGLKLLALGLVLAGLVAYVYSDLVVSRRGAHLFNAVFCLLWAEALVVNLIPNLEWASEIVIAVLALTALAVNLLPVLAPNSPPAFRRATPILGLFLAVFPVLLGVLLQLRATHVNWHAIWPYEITWAYVGVMALTAVCCRASAYLSRHSAPEASAVYFVGTAAATLAGAAGLLVVLGTGGPGLPAVPGLLDWGVQACVVMVIPILYLVASRLNRGHTAERPLNIVAQTATVVLVGLVLASLGQVSERVFDLVTGDTRNLLLAGFFAEVAVFYALSTAFRREGGTVYLATLAACAAVWQLLLYADTPAELYLLAYGAVGLALLVTHRLTATGKPDARDLGYALAQSGSVLLTLALVGGVLMGLSKLSAAQRVSGGTLGLMAGLTGLGLLGAWAAAADGWRRAYLVLTVANGVLALVMAELLLDLPFYQKVELICVAAGVLLLVVGHVGWYREQGRQQSDVVTLCLALGSPLVALPLCIALLYHRSGVRFSTPDELGTLVLGLVLLATGILCRIKATTLAGAVMTALYLATLLMFVRVPDFLKSAALWMVIGGAALFGAGLLLSMYRDRLLALPGRIQRREGVFRLLAWR